MCKGCGTEAVLYADGLLGGEQDLLPVVRRAEQDSLLRHLRQLHQGHHLKTSAVLTERKEMVGYANMKNKCRNFLILGFI